MGHPLPRQFNAINGQELLEIIVEDMRRKAANSGHFEVAETYPWIKNLKWSVAFEVYPHEPPTISLEGEIAVETAEQPKEDEPTQEVKLEGGLKDVGTKIAPDQLREEMGVPVPTPMIESGGIVDVLTGAAKKGSGGKR